LKLKRLRLALDMSQRALAKEFRVAPGAIAQWETGDRTIPGPVLKLIEIYEAKTSKESRAQSDKLRQNSDKGD
jgi:transcriptional regulator with XRE-family HTH domain